MEYTKDIIFKVHYGDVPKKSTEGKWTSRFLQGVKRHKLIITTVFSAIVFICIDIVLITNFFRILTTV